MNECNLIVVLIFVYILSSKSVLNTKATVKAVAFVNCIIQIISTSTSVTLASTTYLPMNTMSTEISEAETPLILDA